MAAMRSLSFWDASAPTGYGWRLAKCLRFGLRLNRNAPLGMDSTEGVATMQTKTAPRPVAGTRPEREPTRLLPTWQNTRPRGNQELDRRDFERSVEKLEMLVGR
jgi:hypothetical protein